MYRDQFGEFVCGYWGLKGKFKFIIYAQDVTFLHNLNFTLSCYIR